MTGSLLGLPLFLSHDFYLLSAFRSCWPIRTQSLGQQGRAGHPSSHPGLQWALTSILGFLMIFGLLRIFLFPQLSCAFMKLINLFLFIIVLVFFTGRIFWMSRLSITWSKRSYWCFSTEKSYVTEATSFATGKEGCRSGVCEAWPPPDSWVVWVFLWGYSGAGSDLGNLKQHLH